MNSTSVNVFAMNSTNSFSSVTHSTDVVGYDTNLSKTVDLSKILKPVFLCIMMIGSIFGNSLVLAAYRTTPSLWTKTNKILASLTVADFWVGLGVLYYVPYILFKSVINSLCSFYVIQVFLVALINMPPYASCFNLIIVAIDRYVAIVYPYEYEMRMTDRVVTVMIAGSWLISFVCSSTFTLWLINADLSKCTTVVPIKYYFLNPIIYVLLGAVVVFVYTKILIVAWHQHIAIDLQRNELEHKLRKAEFKALRLTSAILSALLILWLPYVIGRAMQFVGNTQSFVDDIVNIGLPIGMFNSSINWILYGAVSKTYQKAFIRLLKSCMQSARKTLHLTSEKS